MYNYRCFTPGREKTVSMYVLHLRKSRLLEFSKFLEAKEKFSNQRFGV